MSWSKSFGPGTAEVVAEEVKTSEDPCQHNFGETPEQQAAAAVHAALYDEAKDALVARIEKFAETDTYKTFGVLIASSSGHGDNRNTSYSIGAAIPYDAKLPE